MAETGQTYTQAAASLAVPAQMNRDLPPSEAMIHPDIRRGPGRVAAAYLMRGASWAAEIWSTRLRFPWES